MDSIEEFNQKMLDTMHEIWLMIADIVETKLMPLATSFFRLVDNLLAICDDDKINGEDSLT